MVKVFKKHMHTTLTEQNLKRAFSITHQPVYENRGKFHRQFITAIYRNQYDTSIKSNNRSTHTTR